MANGSTVPPATTPKKSYLEAPLDPKEFVTPISGTLSSMFNDEALFTPRFVIENNFEAADLRLRRTIPVDAFLIGMGVLEVTLEKNDDSISAIASNARTDQLRRKYGSTPTETSRYGPFCDLTNFCIGMFICKYTVFTRNDPKIIGGLYALGGLKPDVVALPSNHVDVSDGKWMKYSDNGPLQAFGATWDWWHVLIPVEFKKQKNTFLPDPEYVSHTLLPWAISPSARLSSTRSSHPSLPPAGRSTPSGASAGVSSSSSKRQRKSTGDDTAVVPVQRPKSTRQPRGPSKRRGRQKSTGKSTPAVSHSGSASGSRNPEPVPAPPAGLRPPHSVYNVSSLERRKRGLEEMKKEDEEVGEPEDAAEVEAELEKFVLRKDLAIDGIKYAIDIMSCVLNRRHVFELLIIDGIMRLAYYDRAGPVYSEPLHFIADLYRFVVLLKRVAEMNRSEIGFLDCVYVDKAPTEEILEAIRPYAETDQGMREAIGEIESGQVPYTLKFDDNTLAYLITEIGGRRHYGLISRGTSVFLCYLVRPDSTGVFAVKLSWPQAWRKSEVEILKEAKETLCEIEADPEFQKVYGVRKLVESLPSVVTAKDLDDLKKEQSFRWRTQQFYENFDSEFNRILRGIVFERLFPLHSVTTLEHFKTAIRDLVLVHHFLWTSKCLIQHRDISLRNLMVRYYPGTDRIKGVLIDFDLASVGKLTTEGHYGRRTGTRPYMARELLGGKTPIHLERFDWESFFYVICWIASHYSYGEKVESDAFKEWDEQDDKKLGNSKAALLGGFTTLRRVFTEFYKPLVSLWMLDLQNMFGEAVKLKDQLEDAQTENPGDKTLEFDKETIRGTITWEKIWGILRK